MSYEFRTLIQCFTFDFKLLSNETAKAYNYNNFHTKITFDLNKIFTKLNLFHNEHSKFAKKNNQQNSHAKCHAANESSEGFELFLIDEKGNLFKKTFLFKS